MQNDTKVPAYVVQIRIKPDGITPRSCVRMEIHPFGRIHFRRDEPASSDTQEDGAT